MADKLRIAVVSPFLDRRHGTERATLEQIERLAHDADCEVHLYAQRVEELETAQSSRGKILWHQVSRIRGPHLFQFVWWLLANQFARWRDVRFGGLRFHLVYSPGINCFDADAIIVHSCFSALADRSRSVARSGNLGFRSLARRMHRKLYYSLLAGLERWLYARRSIALAAVSGRTARELEQRFGRSDVRVIQNAVDMATFNPAARHAACAEARRRFGYGENDFVVLLIGNDWRMKGLLSLLEAASRSPELPLRLLIVGQEDAEPYRNRASQLGMQDRLQFAQPLADVLGFYAAADAYASPTLEDSFGLPVLEAMACGLPAITSTQSGVAEVITHGIDGLILRDPLDSDELARLLKLLCEQPALRRGLGERAVDKARQYTWERNAAETMRFLAEATLAKGKATPAS